MLNLFFLPFFSFFPLFPFFFPLRAPLLHWPKPWTGWPSWKESDDADYSWPSWVGASCFLVLYTSYSLITTISYGVLKPWSSRLLRQTLSRLTGLEHTNDLQKSGETAWSWP